MMTLTFDRLTLTLALLLVFAPALFAQDRTTDHMLKVPYGALFAADALTTHAALATGRAREVMMPTQSPVAIDGILAAQAVGLWWATGKIERGWLKWTVRFGVAGFHGWCAAHNAGVLRQINRRR